MNILFSTFGANISIFQVITRILSAILIGGVIGFERERKNRPAGLRTHVLVCMASGLIAMTEQQLVYEVSTLANAAVNISLGRLTVGVISGIGFIGAGTIMMSKSHVIGLTTAASLWCTACLGLVSGMGYEVVAVFAAILVIFVLQVMRVGERTSLNRIIEVEYVNDIETSKKISELFGADKIKIYDSSVSFRKEQNVKYISERYAVTFKDNDELKQFMFKLADLDKVSTVRIQNVI